MFQIGQGEKNILTYADHLMNFPEKTREEKLLHKIAFLIPAMGLIACLFFWNFLWLVTGLVGHLLAKIMYLESRIFSINYDQYHKLKLLGFVEGISMRPSNIDELMKEESENKNSNSVV